MSAQFREIFFQLKEYSMCICKMFNIHSKICLRHVFEKMYNIYLKNVQYVSKKCLTSI